MPCRRRMIQTEQWPAAGIVPMELRIGLENLESAPDWANLRVAERAAGKHPLRRDLQELAADHELGGRPKRCSCRLLLGDPNQILEADEWIDADIDHDGRNRSACGISHLAPVCLAASRSNQPISRPANGGRHQPVASRRGPPARLRPPPSLIAASRKINSNWTRY